MSIDPTEATAEESTEYLTSCVSRARSGLLVLGL
jgi:hypothetical protein